MRNSAQFLVGLVFSVFLVVRPNSVSSSVDSSSNSPSSSCQCGVFLLGTPPLTYSPDAQPALAGNPIRTNCSLASDRVTCSTSCRSLVDAMSSSRPGAATNTPLVQTVVLAATRALACQKFNSSNNKVPLPRVHLAGPEGRRTRDEDVDNRRWLGGFYRWCDSHWVYAGVSISEPLCCSNGIPTECPSEDSSTSSAASQQNARSPRLIIKKRPEDDLSSEENETELTPTTTVRSSSTTARSSSTTTTKEPNTSMEKITPVIPDAVPSPSSQLNSTVLAEAFGIVGALMRSLGMADVVEGIQTVLPSSTATELLKRVDVGGWVGKYQERYIVYGREFNMAYCYLEYGLYNVAAEGVVSNLISRVFGGGSGAPPPHMSIAGPGHANPGVGPGQGQSHVGQELGSNILRRVRRATHEPSRAKKTKPEVSGTKRSGDARRPQQPGNNQGANLMNMANMLLQLAGTAGGGGGGGGGGGNGDPVNSLLQNALPLMAQVGSSPMIQGVVSNLVTSFLTPPDRPSEEHGDSPGPSRPTPPTRGPNARPPPSSNSAQDQKPSNPGQSDSGLSSMLGQIVQTYIKHYFESKAPGPPPKVRPTPPDKTTESSSSSSPTGSGTGPQAESRLDIVDTISEVAKPFFISYFGLVPGRPGFGQLNIAERSGRVDTLTYDPDPGTSLTDLLFGSLHLPQTGNSVFDFGNRVAFAFSRANDPTQGMYCFKQYSVNKLWDGFRFGVRTLFK